MLLVDARGIPLSIIVTAANHHDVTQLAVTLDAIVTPRPPVAPRARQHLCADAGFVGATADQNMRDRDYTPHVRPRSEERAQRAQGKRARRWVVEVRIRGSRASANCSFATRRCIVPIWR